MRARDGDRRERDHTEITHVDVVRCDAEGGDVALGRLGDRQERRAAVQQLQRQRLGQQRGDRALAAELGHVVVAVDVVHERHPRRAAPQRRQERDPVDDLEHDVRVGRQAAAHRPRRAGEDRHARAHVMQLQPGRGARDRLGALVRARDDRDAIAPLEPERDLPEQVRAGPAALRVRPVAVGQQQDVPHAVRDRSTSRGLHWPAHAARTATPARACRRRSRSRPGSFRRLRRRAPGTISTRIRSGQIRRRRRPRATPRAPAATATPAPAQPAATPAPGQPAPAATAAPPQGPSLPYTGFEDWLPGLGGALLLGAGLTLRARLRADERS